MTTLPLTPRQMEVCVLAMQGFRFREIAKRTGITVGAVGHHLTRAKKHMGARTVRQLMAMLGREVRGVEVS